MNPKLKIALLAILAISVVGFGWLWFAPCGMGGCAPVSELEQCQAEGSELLDADGKPFGNLSSANRRVVPIDSVPEYLPQAFVAIEDRRFYDHGGVDWKRFGGALFANVKRGGVSEGGSTITMQLARNLFPKALPYTERSIRRKVMEIRVARQIERAFGKKKILELYINHIYMGEGAYGVEAAARTYFGKPAAQLTLAEAATIGGLGQLPSRRNPREDKDAARTRRNTVLRAMADAGYVSRADAEAAMKEPMRVSRPGKDTRQRGSYYVERVRRELEDRVGERFYTAGLRVYTAYDPVAQAAAESEVARQAAAIESGAFGSFNHPKYTRGKESTDASGTPYLQGAAVVMDARNGEVRALVGGRDYEDSNYDRIFQALRQPGSAFKPFVYLAAIGQGVPATQKFDDAPLQVRLSRGSTWSPRNYTGTFDGPITVRDALTRSKNVVTVKLAQEVGMGRVADQARSLGITTPVPENPAVALGSAEVRPIELVGAYATFANMGDRVVPHLVRRVETTDGDVLWEAEEEREQVLEPADAFVLTSMLRDVVDRGTGTPVRAAGFRGVAAGKTGTTNAATDVWFVGYTPELVAAVWFGFDKPQTILRGASGGTLAAPVWGRIMQRVYARRRAPLEWAPPRGVVTETVDRATGLAVMEGCPARGPTYTEYFVNSRPAAEPCNLAGGIYPPMAMDTAWRDEEWGSTDIQLAPVEGYNPDTVGMTDLERRGVNWPELEAQRRAGERPRAPEPGRVETYPDPLPPAPAPRPRRTPARTEETPPAEPRRPRVLGEKAPTPPAPEPAPPPAPAPPDTSSGGSPPGAR
ncbi:MAG TPA: PBP1A family penicillin-binding protein [Longimicrobium sp.]